MVDPIRPIGARPLFKNVLKKVSQYTSLIMQALIPQLRIIWRTGPLFPNLMLVFLSNLDGYKTGALANHHTVEYEFSVLLFKNEKLGFLHHIFLLF